MITLETIQRAEYLTDGPLNLFLNAGLRGRERANEVELKDTQLEQRAPAGTSQRLQIFKPRGPEFLHLSKGLIYQCCEFEGAKISLSPRIKLWMSDKTLRYLRQCKWCKWHRVPCRTVE